MAIVETVSSPLLSPIDCQRFGIAIGKAAPASTADVESMLRAAREAGIALLIARTATDNVAVVHALEDAGFRLLESIVYYRRELEEPSPAPRPGVVRTATLHDADAVEAVAREAFRDYQSHYRLDPRLPAAASDAIYPDWARRSVIEQPRVADQVVVAEVGGRIAGFATLNFAGAVADGTLFAVAPAYRGRGIYNDLLLAALGAARAAGCRTMEYSTQLANTAAQCAIARLGFTMHRSVYTFHGWHSGAPSVAAQHSATDRR